MTISKALRERVRTFFQDRCGYCQSSQKYVFVPMQIDHIFPKGLGGRDDESNLCLCCPMCNTFKGLRTQAIDPLTQQEVALFHPRLQKWTDHFRWNDDGSHILGQTPTGRATIIALNMNNVLATMTRHEWVNAGWHPPKINPQP